MSFVFVYGEMGMQMREPALAINNRRGRDRSPLTHGRHRYRTLPKY